MRRHDTNHNDAQLNVIKLNDLFTTLSINDTQQAAQQNCPYAGCNYAECRTLFKLNVVVLSVIVLSVGSP
jgi:hypothetical protein